MTPSRRPILERPAALIAIWCLLLFITAGALAAWQYRTLVAQLEQESFALHRLASQRADQHDAHMTALSAIAVASDGRSFDLFLDVASTIARFYPRIDEIQLVPLDPRAAIVGTAPLDPVTAERIRAAARTSTGQIMLLPHPGQPDHYIMVKRSPNSDAARYGLMLGIDAGKLIGDEAPFWSRPGVTIQLSLPGGHALVGPSAQPTAVRFSRPLGSASQPLTLETGMEIGIGDLLPPLRTGLVLLVVSLACLAALAGLRQRARTRAAVEQARLAALESRLSHASRVNALGEMASGMAHELTQPLTAILAQAQAGRRLAGRGDAAALEPVLEDTINQAKRASAILERFRNWSRPQKTLAETFDLRQALTNVQTLLQPDAASRGIQLDVDVPDRPVVVLADPVEMEQVAFNLVRNAMEALDQERRDTGRVTMRLKDDGSRAVFEVSDNGPGVPEIMQSRLFTPFATTRADGTGLGLALSQRLVERANGEIALVDNGPGATFRVVLPRKKENAEAAQ